MYRELKKYVKRDQLYSAESKKEDFEKFVDKHNSFLYKPDVADCGRGIEKWTVSKGSIEDLYNKFKESPGKLRESIRLLQTQMTAIMELCFRRRLRARRL